MNKQNQAIYQHLFRFCKYFSISFLNRFLNSRLRWEFINRVWRCICHQAKFKYQTKPNYTVPEPTPKNIDWHDENRMKSRWLIGRCTDWTGNLHHRTWITWIVMGFHFNHSSTFYLQADITLSISKVWYFGTLL